jgi:putative ABC transport system ATP-binding protein
MSDQGPHSPTELRLEGVSFEWKGEVVIRSLDLVIRAGEPLAITGPSGSGKSTLCLIIAGVLAPTSGRLLLNRTPWLRTSESRVGLVLQTHGVVSGLTAEENVALPLQSRQLHPADIARRCANALASVGLAGEASRAVDELSGGERQRVGVARALAEEPLVLVADEPTAELDADNRMRLLALLIGPTETPRIVVVASDDPEVLAHFPVVVNLAGSTGE